MGVIFRALALVLGLAFLLCMVAFNITGEQVWRQRALQAAKWGVVLGLCFFGLLILRRAAIVL
jgi:multisubunit Na+/H+ antiporter MnhB subunit